MGKEEAPLPDRAQEKVKSSGNSVMAREEKQCSREGSHQHRSLLCPSVSSKRSPLPEPGCLELSLNSSYFSHVLTFEIPLFQSYFNESGFSCPPKTSLFKYVLP